MIISIGLVEPIPVFGMGQCGGVAVKLILLTQAAATLSTNANTSSIYRS